MTGKITEWKGHHVFGDVNELDAIISSSGKIALDKSDIVNTLNLDGDSYVVTETGETVEEAIEAAISNIPCHTWQVTALAIVLWNGGC